MSARKPSSGGSSQNRKLVLGLVVALVVFGGAALLIAGWDISGEADMGPGPEGSAGVVDHEQIPAREGAAAGTQGAGQGGQAGQDTSLQSMLNPFDDEGNPIDPRLANVSIVELPVDEQEDEPQTEQEKRIQRNLKIATKPIINTMRELSSFVYKGEMKVRVPTMVQSEQQYDAGQRYGEGIEVTSKFTLKKAEDGDFAIEQETFTDKGDTKYDQPEYNGTLYYLDGEFIYIDAKGNRASEEQLDQVLSVTQANNLEPLVRRNWSQIVRDLDLVIDFEPTGSTGTESTYELSAINPEKQEKTVELSKLEGQMTVMEGTQNMKSADINGAGTLRQGYMSGADVSYDINLEVSDVGAVEKIDPPPQK